MSKKNRSLFVQSMTAIEASFTLGYDKHSSKKQSEQPDHSWRVGTVLCLAIVYDNKKIVIFSLLFSEQYRKTKSVLARERIFVCAL